MSSVVACLHGLHWLPFSGAGQWFSYHLLLAATAQVAGFTVRFRAGDDAVRAGKQGQAQGQGQLRYASVKGAGHMVPQSKPAAALHLLRTFLEDGEL